MTTTSAAVATAPYDELAAALRGDLITPPTRTTTRPERSTTP